MMNNNDKLVRLRYALDIKDAELVKIFELGGLKLTKEEVALFLKRVPNPATETEKYPENLYETTIDNKTLEMFYNGLITFKRGKRPLKPGEVEKPVPLGMTHQNGNNVMMKKLKIALALTSTEMVEIIGKAGLTVTESELGAILRKEGHRNYQMCGDNFARNFIKGIALTYRKE
ncbi:DUF1456 family protein [Vagococcus allomyrinae]